MTEPRQPLGQPTGGLADEGALTERDPDFGNEHDDTNVAGDVPGGAEHAENPEHAEEPESPDSHGGLDH